MEYKIVPRQDDGTFDLFWQDAKKELEFLGNFDKLEQAQHEIDKMKKPMSQEETMSFLNDLKKDFTS